MRKLKRFNTNTNLDLTSKNVESVNTFKRTSINDIYSNVSVSDLMLSVLTDSDLNCIEKSIIGLFIDNSLSFDEDYEECKIEFFPTVISVDINSSIKANSVKAMYIYKALSISLHSVVRNMNNLKSKGIIDFEKYENGRYINICFNIGKLSYKYF